MENDKFVGQTYNDLTAVEEVGKSKGGKSIWKFKCVCGSEKIAHRSAVVTGNTKSCGQCKRSTIAKDLSGQIFGRLIVICKSENKGSKTAWSCQCECGNIKDIKTANLLKGRAKSCGCQINYNKSDYIGKIFGRLTVVSKFEKQGSNWYYLCKCECGNETIVSNSHLNSGDVRSCGCLRLETVRQIRPYMKGDKNPTWKGGGSIQDRNCKEYKEWRKAVLRRDQYTCQCCNDTKELTVHHLNSFVDNPTDRFEVSNGVCLCSTCHTCFHIEYGYGENSIAQFQDFLSKNKSPQLI